MKRWQKVVRENGNQKRAGVAILVSDKIHFKSKTLKIDKEGHYIMIRGQLIKRI